MRSDADHVWHENQAVPPHKPGMYCQSRYLTMRDGIRIAVNLYLPTHRPAGARMPAIINQTRYYRAMELRQLARAAMRGKPFHHIPSTVACRRRFVGAGYAWVDVDVRGSGASFGHRVCEWSPDEIRDGAEVVDWIIRQPWSDGAVGALGSSYSGGAAELLLVNRHPAVRAVAPRFSPFDAYSDIAFPGGVRARWFTETWGRYNAALDRNAPWDAAGWWVRLFVTGCNRSTVTETARCVRRRSRRTTPTTTSTGRPSPQFPRRRRAVGPVPPGRRRGTAADRQPDRRGGQHQPVQPAQLLA